MTVEKVEKGRIDPENKLSDKEYNNRRRLEAINDSRELVSDTVLHAERELMHRAVDESRADWAVHASVKMLIRECEWVIKNHSKSEQYFQEVPIGSMDISSGTGEINLLDNIPGTVLNDGLLEFYGLSSVLKAPRRLEVAETYESDSHLHGKESKSRVIDYTLPRHISMSAYDVVFDVLGKSDLNLTFDGGRQLGRVTPEIGDDA